MKTEPLAMSQMVSSMEGRKEQLFRSGGDLSIDKGRPEVFGPSVNASVKYRQNLVE